MARKPPPLPDVFAKPGGAPSRGTPIEDLPQPDGTVALQERPPPEAPPPPPPPLPPELPEPPVSAQPAPPPDDEPYVPPPPRPRAAPGGRAFSLAVIAVAISLTAPFWEDAVLSVLGAHTPNGRVAEMSILAMERQDRRTADIGQRLATATEQLARQQAEFTAAMQRMDRSATLIRTMALVRLSDALRRPAPFAAELAVARASGTDLGDLKPLLDEIQAYADTGIPGVAQLRRDFHALTDQLARSDSGGASWISSLTSWARPRGAAPMAVAADPSLELLQTATAQLADGDVAGALERTQQVGELYRPAFATWIEDARARVAADTLAERASDMVTKALQPAATK
jgi:hypothetical protein